MRGVTRVVSVHAALFLAISLGLLVDEARAVPGVGFPDGVASGEVTATSAVLWTRVDTATPLQVEVSTSSDFRGPKAFKQNLHPSVGDDLTVKALATGLEPATHYFYRWRHGSARSPVGEFTTAPDADTSADLRFAYTGDSDGQFQQAFGNNFEVLDAVRAEGADFWIYLGDTIYSDSSLKAVPSTTLEEYRADYKLNRTIQALPDLLQSTSTYSVADDHEVQNDYSGQSVDPARYAAGRRAFVDYNPLLEINLLEDPICAGDPLFRTVKWGSEVELFILDERSCRSPSVDEGSACHVMACSGGTAICTTDGDCPLGEQCIFPTNVDDLAPTLPPPVRAGFGGLIPVNPPAGCLAAIFDPTRTLLGPVQKQALKDALVASTASFKIIVNEVPIQQFWALPYDRWEGYGAERNEILGFIQAAVSGTVLFVTTDTHANLFNHVVIDTFLAPTPIATEVVTGPIATNTFETEVLNFPGGVPGPVLLGAFHQVLNLAGVQCRELDLDSYALVEVDAAAGKVTITAKDENGNVIENRNPTDPFNKAPCVVTLP